MFRQTDPWRHGWITRRAAVNVGRAWKANWTGTGIGVAVIDSGVSQSPDLAVLGLLSAVVYTKDFTAARKRSIRSRHACCRHRWRERVSSHCLGCTRSLVGMAPTASIINLAGIWMQTDKVPIAPCWQRSRSNSMQKVYNIA